MYLGCPVHRMYPSARPDILPCCCSWHFNPEQAHPYNKELPCIGELLKRKAAEGEVSAAACPAEPPARPLTKSDL